MNCLLYENRNGPDQELMQATSLRVPVASYTSDDEDDRQRCQPPGKVKKIEEDSLDSIPSPSTSVKIQIMGGKVGLRYKGKTLLGIANKLLNIKSLLTSPSDDLLYYFK